MPNQQKRRSLFKRKKRQEQSKPNYAFIDSQNLNLGVQRIGWKMDWRKFRQFLKTKYGVEKAYMFIGYVPDNESLYKQMQDAGYVVVLKPTVDMLMSEEELAKEKHVTKGNADAELVLYGVKEMPHYDKAIVVSGDGDFYCLVEYLEQQGKLKQVLAPNNHYSTLYRPYENYITSLENYKKELKYASVRPKVRTKGNKKTRNKK